MIRASYILELNELRMGLEDFNRDEPLKRFSSENRSILAVLFGFLDGRSLLK